MFMNEQELSDKLSTSIDRPSAQVATDPMADIRRGRRRLGIRRAGIVVAVTSTLAAGLGISTLRSTSAEELPVAGSSSAPVVDSAQAGQDLERLASQLVAALDSHVDGHRGVAPARLVLVAGIRLITGGPAASALLPANERLDAISAHDQTVRLTSSVWPDWMVAGPVKVMVAWTPSTLRVAGTVVLPSLTVMDLAGVAVRWAKVASRRWP